MINQPSVLAGHDTGKLTSRAVSRSEKPDKPSRAMPRCNTRLHAPGLASKWRTLRDADNIVYIFYTTQPVHTMVTCFGLLVNLPIFERTSNFIACPPAARIHTIVLALLCYGAALRG